MASSQDIDFQPFVRPKRLPPIPLVDGLPVPVDSGYRLPNANDRAGGTPHRKTSLPASPSIPTIPTVHSDEQLNRHDEQDAGAGSRPTLPGVPVSKPRTMSRMTPYGGVSNSTSKKKGMFGFSLGRGRSTYRPSMLSKPVVVVQPGPTVSVHVPASVAPPPQVGMAMRRSRSAPPPKDRRSRGEVDVEGLPHVSEDDSVDGGLALGVKTAMEIMRSMSGNPSSAVELAIGDIRVGSVTFQEFGPVVSGGTDEGVADVGPGEATFDQVGEGYEIWGRPAMEETSLAQEADLSDDSSFEMVGPRGYPGINFITSSTIDIPAPNAKQMRQLEKEEARSRKFMSKIVKGEAKMERQSLKMALTELEGLQRAHKESMKLEANAITGHSKTKSEHTKNLSLFEGLKREYQIMERKVETSAIALKQADDALEQHKERVREAMRAVKEKKVEVDLQRTQRDAEERGSAASDLSGSKGLGDAPGAFDGDRIGPSIATKRKAKLRLSGVMAPL